MKNTIYLAAICLFAWISIQATDDTDYGQLQEYPKPANLKVLPKNISHEELEATMKAFNQALGVKCGFCHAPRKDGEKGLDFASDANPKKDVARSMMKMTNKINKKYFKNFKKDGDLLQIGCQTCHNGQAEPVMRKMH